MHWLRWVKKFSRLYSWEPGNVLMSQGAWIQNPTVEKLTLFCRTLLFRHKIAWCTRDVRVKDSSAVYLRGGLCLFLSSKPRLRRQPWIKKSPWSQNSFCIRSKTILRCTPAEGWYSTAWCHDCKTLGLTHHWTHFQVLVLCPWTKSHNQSWKDFSSCSRCLSLLWCFAAIAAKAAKVPPDGVGLRVF